MVKCSLMTFSFAIIFLFSNPLFLDMDTSALSRIVEEHLDNYHDFVTHLTEIMRGLHARNIYVYFHGNQRRSQLLHQTITLVNHCETSPVIVAQSETSKISVEEGIKSLVITLIPDTNINPNEALKHVEKKMHSKSKYYFLIIIESPVDKQGRDISAWIRDLFQVFWLKRHLNAVLMYWESGLRIISYSPFNEDFLLPLTNDTVSIDYLFPDKVINMNLRQLHVSLFADGVRAIISPEGDLSGADGYMATLMVERMNATLDLQVYRGDDPYGSLMNGSTNGTLSEVATGHSNVAFNMRFLIYNDFSDIVENTIIYGRDDLCILVPSSGLKPKITNIFRSFDRHVWLMVITIFLAMLLSIKCIKWTEMRNHLSRDNNLSILTLLRIQLNQTIPRISQTLRGRVIVACWIFYCFVISNAYLAHLISNLLLRLTQPQINTLANLEKSNYTVLAIPKYAKLIESNLNYKNDKYESLVKRLQRVTFKKFHEELSMNNVKVAYAHKRSFLKLIMEDTKRTYHDRPIFHLMKECPVPFLTVYIVEYGSPFLNRINTIMRRVEEIGLTYHWHHYLHMERKVKDKTFERNTHDGPIPLRLDHMQTAFYILAFGLVLGLLTFIYELCHHKKSLYGPVKRTTPISIN